MGRSLTCSSAHPQIAAVQLCAAADVNPRHVSPKRSRLRVRVDAAELQTLGGWDWRVIHLTHMKLLARALHSAMTRAPSELELPPRTVVANVVSRGQSELARSTAAPFTRRRSR